MASASVSADSDSNSGHKLEHRLQLSVCVLMDIFHKCAKESMLANLLMAKKAPLFIVFGWTI